MIKLVYANRTESLLGELAADLERRRGSGAHPLVPVELVTPNRNMEAWVRLNLAQARGIAANLRFRRLERFIGEIIAEAAPGEVELVDLDTIEAALLAIFLDDKLLRSPDLQPIRNYLEGAKSTGPLGKDAVIAINPVKPLGETGQEPLTPPAFKGRVISDGTDLRRVQLAARLAYLFQEYTFSRPEMIDAWLERGVFGPVGQVFADPAAAEPALAGPAAWQRALWREVFGPGGILEKNPPGEGKHWVTLDRLTLDNAIFKKFEGKALPPVHVFGISYVARLFQLLFARLGQTMELYIYALNPCAEFWEDVETQRELFKRLDREKYAARGRKVLDEGSPGEDPFGLLEADNPALHHWGRPGREHIRLLNELTDCDFTSAFTDPLAYGKGLLHLLQQDILMREPERVLPAEYTSGGLPAPHLDERIAKPLPADETIRLIAAPSVRREVEWVTDEIWKLLRDDRPAPGEEPLRFSDIAVIVNSAGCDTYLPQIEAVFRACHNLPCSISDLPGASDSRLIEAMTLLLALPFGRFSRPEMIALIGHPAITGSLENLAPAEAAALADELGIIFGADRGDHAGTYIDMDVYNWDQGLKRLALGTFMTGEKSGDQRIYEAAGGRWLVRETPVSSPAEARFGLLARSLLADACFVLENRLTLSGWAAFFRAQVDAYLNVQNQADARDRLRLVRALGRLEAMDFGLKASGRTACELARRALVSIGGGRGSYLAEGVVVSSFLPMRAIPFRVVFLLGLGEGQFPAPARRDALDLRTARRRAGDVDPAERDRYMFLETLLCARERLYLSYVARDGQTGDSLQPSAVVQELMHIIERGYLGESGLKDLRVEPPLRRYDGPRETLPAFIDEARVEATVKELAGSWAEGSGSAAGSADFPFLANLGRESVTARIIKGIPPAARQELSALLVLPGDPPPVAPAFPTMAVIPSAGETPAEEPINLSISALVRFLECPMQGWASVMLGLSEAGEDPADREEEDFEVGRLVESGFLRDIFIDATAGGVGLTDLYCPRADRLRLQGKMPVGILGRETAKRHLALCAGWQNALAGDLGLPTPPGGGAFYYPLRRVRFGRAGERCECEEVFEPLSLEVNRQGPGGDIRRVQVRINGLTGALSADGSLSVIPRQGLPPTGRKMADAGRVFRYLLRGLVDQALLAAAGAAGGEECRVVGCFAGNGGETALGTLNMRRPGREEAAAWLTALVGDLLGGSHAYLLPCEAVFFEYRQGGGKPPQGERLLSLVRELAGDEYARFSSLWGPVPSPRLYSPPGENEISDVAFRRFRLLWECRAQTGGF